MKVTPPKLILSCEHAMNFVPSAYRALFEGNRAVLSTHRGYDPGALALTEILHRRLGGVPRHFALSSRLLVECNRSLHHKNLFSEFSRTLSQPEKKIILDTYYFPYRNAVENEVKKAIASGTPALHLSLHSFTPVLNGEVRKADLGLLYDPQSPREKAFCDNWAKRISTLAPDLRVRKNYPYLGTADSLTTFLRRKYAKDGYAGIELEMNQRFPLEDSAGFKRLCEVIFESLHNSLD